MNTDITRVRFSDSARWGEKDNFKVVEEEILEKFLKCSFDWENITATDEDVDRLKDFVIHVGVNWEGDLQFIKDEDKILVKSTLNSILLTITVMMQLYKRLSQ